MHHQPRFTRGQFSQITPGPNGYDQVDLCGAQGWYGEETLDVEAVHAMAPGARIVYVGASDCLSGLDDAWASAIDNHVADVITNSWTDGTDDINLLGSSYVAFYQQFSLEAALTGITVNFSSGDSGDHTAGGTDLSAKTVEFPADLPYVTGVGGTSVLIGSRGQWLGEYGWQNAYSTLTNGAWTPAPPGNYSSGGGGGTSQLFTQPFYQAGKVPASISQYYGEHPDAGGAGHRDAGRPQHRLRGRRDPGVPRRHLLGSVPDRRDQPVVPAAGRGGGGGRPVAPPTAGVHQPASTTGCWVPRRCTTSSRRRSPLAQVRTDYVNFLDNTQGKFFRLQTIDVQSSTLHDTPGYDDETGVGTPNGPAFFLGALHH